MKNKTKKYDEERLDDLELGELLWNERTGEKGLLVEKKGNKLKLLCYAEETDTWFVKSCTFNNHWFVTGWCKFLEHAKNFLTRKLF